MKGSRDSKEVSLKVAQKISKLFESSVLIGQHNIQTSVSIGVVFFPEHGNDYPSLISSADNAMYQAKKAQVPFVFCNNDSSS